MSCHDFDRRISPYLDGRLTGREHEEASLHFAVCGDCTAAKHELQKVRGTLRALPSRKAPTHLSVSLRIAASKERVRRSNQASLRARLSYWRKELRLSIDNLMRPLAIPAAGGLASAIVLFSMLVPTFAKLKPLAGASDIPTPFYTAATVKRTLLPFGSIKDELFVDVTIDVNGRMVAYSIPQGQPAMLDAELIRNLEEHLVYTQFTPATTFGQPVYGGRLLVHISRKSIDVRG